MKIRVLKLGSVCKDKATGLKGTITHWMIDMGGRIDYFFQPPGLNPDDGQPIKRFLVEEQRLETSEDQFEKVEVPTEILGTTVTDKASGFSGIAVNFIRHMSGCFHVFIQPPGVLEKTNSPVKATDFDLRGCEGEKIEKVDDKKLEESRQEKPSPAPVELEDQSSFISSVLER